MSHSCNGTMIDKPYLPLRVGDLPKAVVARAERELGETEEVKARAFTEMRKLISQEPNFTCPTYDDYLLMFLRPRKFDVDRAFKLLQASWGVKRKYGYLYEKYDEESLMRTFGLKSIFCLPYRDSDGATIFIVKMRNWDPNVCSLDEFVTALTYVCFSITSEPVTQVCGIRIIIDVGGMSLKQFRNFNSTIFLILANAFNATIPARWAGIHIYNESVIWSMMWSVLKKFLSQKLRNRVHLHGSKSDELYDYVPKEILPVEYGGNNKADVGAWYITEMEKYFDQYREYVNYGYSK